MSRINDEDLHAMRVRAAELQGKCPLHVWSNDDLLSVINRLRMVEWERDQLRIAMADAGFSLKADLIATAAIKFYPGEDNVHWVHRRAVAS